MQINDFLQRVHAQRQEHEERVRAIISRLLGPKYEAQTRRAKLHLALDALLDLEGEAATEPGASMFWPPMDRQSWRATAEAQRVARALIQDAAGWINGSGLRTAAQASFDATNPRRWRQEMAFHLCRGVHAFPMADARELAEALLALNDETGRALLSLTPLPKHSRQGRDPLGARRAELILLTYIEYRHALGDRKAIVEAEVATAVTAAAGGSLTVDGVRKWKAAAIKAFGKDHVDRHLKDARAYALNGRSFSDEPNVLEAMVRERSEALRDD